MNTPPESNKDQSPPGSTLRRWYRLHLSTYVVLVLTATALFFLNVPGERTTEFGVYPYDRLHERTVEDDPGIVIVSGNTWQIRVNHLLVHGWPGTWLVRDVRGHDDPETSESRDTRIWSFSEDLRQFYPGRLAVNIAVGIAVTAAVGVIFECWRRRRRRLWQQTIWDWLVLMAAVGVATAFAIKTAREYQEERAGLSGADLLAALENDPDTFEIYQLIGFVTRTSGGPSWLRELLGDAWPPWFERTVQLDVSPDRLEYLSNFPNLRALRINTVRLDDDRLSVLSSLSQLELLFVERGTILAGFVDRDPNYDTAVAQLLGYLEGLDRLAVLRLDSCAFGNESARAVTALPMLRILVVDDAGGLTDDGLAAIAQCERLEVLDLRVGDRITSEGIAHLRSLPQLRILKLRDSTGLDDTPIDALKMQRALEELVQPVLE
ncbi:MAG: hypothetical protein WD894_10375 [Pirellulales bacterium]